MNAWFYFIADAHHSIKTPSFSNHRVEIIKSAIEMEQVDNQCEFAEALSNLKDSDGNTALSLTDAPTKNLLQSYFLFCSRYEITSERPEHQSATSVVVFANDHKKIRNVKQVVLKFTENKEQYDREIEKLQKLGSKYVVQMLHNSTDDKLRNRWTSNNKKYQILTGRGYTRNTKNLFDYKYGIVMEPGNRNLQTIFNSERLDIFDVRNIAKNILECLKHIHSNNIMHGDIKMSNFVRFADGTYRLIDFDASEVIGFRYVGAKFSSACLPPEMIHKFKWIPSLPEGFELSDLSEFYTYWENVKRFDYRNDILEWREKIEPKISSKSGYYFCIKTFQYKYDELNQPIITDRPLPYGLVRASNSIDIWSFGVMLYHLHTGCSFVRADVSGDFESGDDMEFIYSWNETLCKEKLAKNVKDPKIMDLLSLILKHNPVERPTAYDLLQHAFFDPQSSLIQSNGTVETTEKAPLNLTEHEILQLSKLLQPTRSIENP